MGTSVGLGVVFADTIVGAAVALTVGAGVFVADVDSSVGVLVASGVAVTAGVSVGVSVGVASCANTGLLPPAYTVKKKSNKTSRIFPNLFLIIIIVNHYIRIWQIWKVRFEIAYHIPLFRNSSSFKPKWWPISCSTVFLTWFLIASSSLHKYSIGFWKIVILSGGTIV